MKTNNFFCIYIVLCPFFIFFTNEIDKELSSPFYSKDGKFEIDNQDTISAHFPFLADILDFYYVYYLAMPDNLDELEEFIDSMHVAYPEELYYYDILKKQTLVTLKENKAHLFFRENECEFQLWMQEKDSTILLYNGGKKCCDLDCFPHPEEKFAIINQLVNSTPKAFNAKNKIIIMKTQLSNVLLNEIMTISQKYKMDKDKATLIGYIRNDGLFNYCNKERIDNNEPYFKEIEIMLKQFCDENGIYRLVFYTYCPHSSVF